MKKWSAEVRQRIEKSGMLNPRTKSAKIRACLPAIESAVQNGYSYARCIEMLGLDITEKYFRTALHRVRRSKRTLRSEVLLGVSAKSESSDELKKENSEPMEQRKTVDGGSTVVLKKTGGMFISYVEEKDTLIKPVLTMEDYL